jgi:hypothetical protein
MKDTDKSKFTVVTPEFTEKYHSENPQYEENDIRYKQAEKELAEAIEKLKTIKPRPDPDDRT